MKNNSLIVALALMVSLQVNAEGISIRKQYGHYAISISQSFETYIGKIIIKDKEKVVFEESGVDDHYFFGNNFDESLKGRDPYSGKNITGNGVPNFIVSKWTGGAHCCNFLEIFELGKDIKKIITIHANSSSIHFVDLDNDGIPEIEFYDGAIDYLFACYAGSPGGRVILKFKNGYYELATDLMKKPEPCEAQIKAIKSKMSSAFKKEESPDLPYEFLKTMMDLSYSGHFELALKIASEVWPANKPGLSQFKEDFKKALQSSLYWKNF